MQPYKINKISQIEKSQLLNFYKKTYHKRYKSLTNNWSWWYRTKYSKFEPLILSLDNNVIGQAGLLPVDLKVLGEKIPAIYFVDFAILSEYRNKGFGEKLTKEWMKICPNQITFCNDQSLKIFKKLRWKNNLSTNRLLRPINASKFLPFAKNFRLNFIDKTLRYFIKKKYNRKIQINPLEINDNYKFINDTFKKKINIKNNVFAEIIRDENWLYWRLMECPYKKDIYFFEYQNSFAIVHIFKIHNMKRLNILFNYSIDSTLANELFLQIINWSLNNEIDVIWMVNKNIEHGNIFPSIFSKAINFASWSSDEKISKILNNGLLDSQGIDSDIDSSMYVE